jgi:hypothetical protein
LCPVGLGNGTLRKARMGVGEHSNHR